MSKRAHYKNRGMQNKNNSFKPDNKFKNPNTFHIQHFGYPVNNQFTNPNNFWNPNFFDTKFCYNYCGKKEPMNVSVIYEDGSENEIDLNFCCANCSQKAYGWGVEQFSEFFKVAQKQILVPATVITSNDLASFLMSNKREI